MSEKPAAGHFVRSVDDIAALKQQLGKDIYLMGGAQTTAGFIDAGLVDELQLIVHPLIAGDGKALFGGTKNRQKLHLKVARPLADGRVGLSYTIG